MTEYGWIISFGPEEAQAHAVGISDAGGKGANLLRMAQAGLPVPGGFIITTDAYRAYVRDNGLEDKIRAAVHALETAGPDDIAALEKASQRIAGIFTSGKIPAPLEDQILEAYQSMGCAAVAVRSSATAEDLPDMSFAGQQDTYLNITGMDALLNAVVRCWASLWTARAIGYRMRNHVDSESAALAVIVQRMVESEASGVLFTANPLTGLRGETVINAAFGLGEALVSGQVEPDQYVVSPFEQKICSKELGAKAVSIHGSAGGGTVHVEERRKDRQALSDAQILELAALGERVEKLYGSPQDIEWGLASSEFSLLQARPITSLYPDLEDVPPHPLKIYMSFASVQGMLDPITPLGRYILFMVFAAGGRLYGFHFRPETQPVVRVAGERLWINLSTPVRNRLGRKIVRGALDYVDPAVRQVIDPIFAESDLQPGKAAISPGAFLRILRFLVRAVWNMDQNLHAPERRRAEIVSLGEEFLEDLKRSAAKIAADPSLNIRDKLLQQTALFSGFVDSRLPGTFLKFVSLVASGMASYNLLRVLSNQLPESVNGGINNGWSRLALEVVRGLPNNPTTEMDLALWNIVREIRQNPGVLLAFQQEPRLLAEQYARGQLPGAASDLIRRFLEQYGGRGLAEIDAGRARWSEDPGHIFEVLSGYLKITGEEQAPDVAFARGAAAAEEAVAKMVTGLRKVPHGWLKARIARFAARRVRALMGARESPKFFAVRMIDVVRKELLHAGEALVQEGALEQVDDLFFLTFPEIKEFASGSASVWMETIRQRRESYQREMNRRLIPRVLLSDGRAYYDGISSQAGPAESLSGSPVSPGSVEGVVRVVLDPRQSNLRPGEIMVCPGTDPSWTPLFLTASGLIMEVGGMMTHGAVVAREYGLPAIVGVDRATHRLVTGQRVRLNGSNGRIDLLDGEGEAHPTEQQSR